MNVAFESPESSSFLNKLDVYFLLNIIECIFAVWIFALSTNILRLDISKLSRYFNHLSPNEIEYRRLQHEIEEINLKMSKLSPVNDFALYFKNERVRNKLSEQQTKISQSIKQSSFLNSLKTTLFVRAALAIFSMILTFHCANKIVLLRIPAQLFYPFNFMFSFPTYSIKWIYSWLYRDRENFQNDIPISLFNFLLMGLFVRKVYLDRCVNLSKKIY